MRIGGGAKFLDKLHSNRGRVKVLATPETKGKRTKQLPSINATQSSPSRKYKPREDQVEAIKEVHEGFQEHNRGQLILPCGTGKTLTGLWIKEKEQSKKTLVCVPSLALVKQTKDSWQAQKTKDFDYLCICSDKDVEDKDDSIKLKATEIDQNGSRVTTNPQDIKKFLDKKGDQVVYCTYQSLPKLIEAMANTKHKFDLALMDEAHKTTGMMGDLFTLIHDDTNVPIEKRLYMTATPKIASDRDTNQYGDLLADMSNESIYGPEFYRMSFAQAIDKGILSDYKIIAVGVTDADIKATHQQPKNDNEYQDLVNNIALEKVMKKHKANHALTFHSRVARAEAFQQAHSKLYPRVFSQHVSGKQNTEERKKIMDRFAAIQVPNRAVLSNAKCLTEGIDIPAIDLVYFCDPKNSTVDIVQAAGRAFRKNPKKPNKIGYIVVPILHGKEENLDHAIKSSRFKNLLKVIRALADHDERLVAKICLGNGSTPNPDPHPQPPIVLEGIDEDALKNQIFDQIIEKSRLRLKSMLYKNFDEAKAAILVKCSTRPGGVASYFNSRDEYQDKGLEADIGIGFKALTSLAIENRKLSEETATPTNLANLIWGGEIKAKKEYKNFEEVKIAILRERQVRPSSVAKYFNSQGELKDKGLEVDIGIGRGALTSLAIASGKLTEETATDANLANLIWGGEIKTKKEYKDFKEAKAAILVKCSTRPSQVGDYFDSQNKFKNKGLEADIRIGCRALTSLAIASGKLTEETATDTNLANLIWGKVAKKEYKDFKEAKAAILIKCPIRPNNIYDYFASQHEFKNKGLEADIGVGGAALKGLAITSRKLMKETATPTNLANLIWGGEIKAKKEYKSFEEAKVAILKKRSTRPRRFSNYFTNQDEFKNKGLEADIGIGRGVLTSLAIKSGKLKEGTATYNNLANLIWGENK